MPPCPATPSILCPAKTSPGANSRIFAMLSRTRGRMRPASGRRPKGRAMDQPAHLIAAGSGDYVHFRALGTRYVVGAEQTGGGFALLEHDLAPRELGSPTHTHEREDEISHVTSGRLGVQIGDQVLEAGPGDTVVKPRRIPHAFWNPGEEPV